MVTIERGQVISQNFKNAQISQMRKKPRTLDTNAVSTEVWRATNSGLLKTFLTLLSEQSGKHKTRVLDSKQTLSPKSS